MPQTPPRQDLQYSTIDDFRPGIISQSNFSLSTGAAVPYSVSGQPGAAQENGTVGCIALINGGLGPLPGPAITTISQTSNPATTYINGVVVHGLSAHTYDQDEVIFGAQYIDGSNNGKFTLYSYLQSPNALTSITSIGPEPWPAGGGYPPLTGGMTRVNPSAPYLSAGQPVAAIGYEWVGQTTGPTAYNWLYPNPSAPGAFTLQNLSPAWNPSILFTHQNRIIVASIQNYSWTGYSSVANTNESFYYTDPPNSPVMGSQGSVFVQEEPTGIGAVGSVSAGELFLVKHSHGGYIISGDLNSPTITWLGGVTPCFGTYSQSCSAPIGYIYASNANGVWVWNGGNTSQKISLQLRDDFYQTGSQIPTFSAASWGEWICMTNGWLFDTTGGGWWRITNPGFDSPPQWYATSGDGDAIWAVAGWFNSATSPIIAYYDSAFPVSTYTWKSYPLQASIDRVLNIRKVAVRAQGVGTITITIEGLNGSNQPTTPSSVSFNSGSQPVLQQMDIGCIAQDITISITSSNGSSGPAPTIYSISVGYYEDHPVNAT